MDPYSRYLLSGKYRAWIFHSSKMNRPIELILIMAVSLFHSICLQLGVVIMYIQYIHEICKQVRFVLSWSFVDNSYGQVTHIRLWCKCLDIISVCIICATGDEENSLYVLNLNIDVQCDFSISHPPYCMKPSRYLGKQKARHSNDSSDFWSLLSGRIRNISNRCQGQWVNRRWRLVAENWHNDWH